MAHRRIVRVDERIVGKVSPNQVVTGGGHLINLTHAGQVNAFLSEWMARHAGK